jgi:DNA-binding transcriptional regulator YhcF (GntR family)
MIELDPDSKDPPYVQLRAAITYAIATGELAPGDPLPTIRQLAGDLDLAPNTVARAYRELEADGLVRARGRRGTHVAPAPPTPPADRVARRQIDVLVDDARRRGLDGATILRLVSEALARP